MGRRYIKTLAGGGGGPDEKKSRKHLWKCGDFKKESRSYLKKTPETVISI